MFILYILIGCVLTLLSHEGAHALVALIQGKKIIRESCHPNLDGDPHLEREKQQPFTT